MKNGLCLVLAVTMLLSCFTCFVFAEETENIALGKEASSSSQYGETMLDDYVVDGDKETVWASWASKGDTSPYVQVDLAAHYFITHVEVWARKGFEDRLEKGNMQCWGSNYADFREYDIIGDMADLVLKSGEAWKFDLDGQKSYRFIRVRHKQPQTCVVAELVVNGELDASVIPNQTPEIRTPKVEGEPVTYNELSVDFTYFDADGDAPVSYTYQWLTSFDETSGYVNMPEAQDATISLDNDGFDGIWLACDITVTDSAGIKSKATRTTPVQISKRADSIVCEANLECRKSNIRIGETARLDLYGIFKNGDAANNSLYEVSYVSRNPLIAEVNEYGYVSGVDEGTTEVYAYYHEKSGQVKSNVITVTVAEPTIMKEFYVDAAAQSGGDGSEETPFASLEEARDAVRNINSDMTGDIFVYLRGGRYQRQETFALTEQDSGSNGFRVIWRSYPGEIAEISGGQTITGWELYDAEKGIWQARLNAPLYTRQLFVNGKRAVRARSENGFLKNATAADSSGHTTTTTEIAGWRNLDEVEIVYDSSFTNPRCRISSVSVNSGVASISMMNPGWSYLLSKGGTKPSMPWYVENAYELMDEKGEWYIDNKELCIYYIPRDGEDMSTVKAEAPVLENLMTVDGTKENAVSNIEFKNIHFTLAAWLTPSSEKAHPDLQANVVRYTSLSRDQEKMFELSSASVVLCYADNIRVDGCRFDKLGGAAMNWHEGCSDNEITGSIFEDISAGGIQIGNPEDGLGRYGKYDTTDSRNCLTDNIVYGNIFRDLGIEYRSACAVYTSFSTRNTVMNNKIENVGYSGISVGLDWGTTNKQLKEHHIFGNYVKNAMSELDDGAAIYCLGGAENSHIKGNYVDTSTGSPGGVYLDNSTSCYTVTNNVVVDTGMCLKVTDNRSHDNIYTKNYVSTMNYSSAGLNSVIGGNTFVNKNALPAESVEIRKKAGLPQRYLYLERSYAIPLNADGEPQLMVNGSIVECDSPVLETGGGIMIPVRAAAQALGAAVEWDGKTRSVSVSKDGKTLVFNVGNVNYEYNGSYGVFGIAPVIYGERAMVCAEDFANILGYAAFWYSEKKTMVID